MATAIKQAYSKSPDSEMSYTRWSVVQHANPATFFMHTLALMWGLHFAWQNQLGAMILAIVGFNVVGALLALPMNKAELARRPIGQWFDTARSWPVGLSFVVSIALLFHGAWQNSGAFIMLGVTALVLTVAINCHLFLRRRYAGELWANA